MGLIGSRLARKNRGNRRNSGEPSGSSESVQQGEHYDLPIDILENILSRLSLRDNIRASVVCKTWRDVALSVRRADRPPCLVNLPKTGHLYEFYDPSNRKTYSMEFPELFDAKVMYAKDGWWLLAKPTTQQIFFFHPYTFELINMPNSDVSYQAIAFSVAPTSPSCIVFTMEQTGISTIAISTCSPGDSVWTTINYESNLPFFCSMWNKVVFYDDIFYCLSLTGSLGIYIHNHHTWCILDKNLPASPDLFSVRGWWKGKFMAEHNGDIYVVCACPGVDPTICKLNRVTSDWEVVQDFCGKTFFSSVLTSNIKADLLGEMRNNIYFSGLLYYGKHCIRYSLEDRRYYPHKDGFGWGELEPFNTIWFDAPGDPSAMPQR